MVREGELSVAEEHDEFSDEHENSFSKSKEEVKNTPMRMSDTHTI